MTRSKAHGRRARGDRNSTGSRPRQLCELIESLRAAERRQLRELLDALFGRLAHARVRLLHDVGLRVGARRDFEADAHRVGQCTRELALLGCVPLTWMIAIAVTIAAVMKLVDPAAINISAP